MHIRLLIILAVMKERNWLVGRGRLARAALGMPCRNKVWLRVSRLVMILCHLQGEHHNDEYKVSKSVSNHTYQTDILGTACGI